MCLLATHFVTNEAHADEPSSLSPQLQVLEKDLGNPDYLKIVGKMIPTDLAAEWRRVATPDNHHLFAKQHGGTAAVTADAALKAGYLRRKEIADKYLALMREAYEKKRLKPPFDDEATLLKALESAGKQQAEGTSTTLPIRPILPCEGAEKQWPSFRGPTGQGIVLETNVPLNWSPSENVLWRQKLPGRGNSSPVVWGDRIFVTVESEPRPSDAGLSAKETAPDRLLLCYSREGKLRWTHTAPRPAEHEVLYWKNTLASSTCVTDSERVIAFFGNAGLVCCDHEGRPLWHVDLGLFPTTHGPGTSPVLYKDLVIVIQDQNKGKSLCAAFNKRTGKRIWERERKNSMGWSNPVLLRVGDRDELIYNGSGEVTSYDPASGQTLWSLPGPSIESIPMIGTGDDLLFSASGRNGPVFAMQPGQPVVASPSTTNTSREAPPSVVWRHETGGPHVPSPLFHEGRLFLISDTGIAMCLNAKSGDLLWQKRLRGRFSTSPLLLDDRVLVTSEEGVTYILKSAAEFEVLAENPLEETIYATPAILGGRIYFRAEGGLICIGAN